jgi:predicted nucleic acid-binding protein
MPLYLLDTNILVHAVRRDGVWSRLQTVYQLLLIDPRPLISVVTTGEVRSLAYQWGWATTKREQMEFLLGYFKVVTIFDPAIIETYAVIDSSLQLRGQSLGKNDLWIAATASVTGATLLTTDRDFDSLQPDFVAREWIDPTS